MTMPDSDDPSDQISEKVRGYLVVAVTVAARVAEVHMHRQAQLQQEAERRGHEAVRAAREQLRAEAAVVKHDLRDVNKTEWWDKATIEQVASGYATARAYGREDVELAGISYHMREEIQSRYGVDAEQLVQAAEESVRAFTDRGLPAPQLQLANDQQRQVAAQADAYVDRIIDRAVDVRQGTPTAAEEVKVAVARIGETDRILTQEYGPDWPARDDLRDKDISFTAGQENDGVLSATRVEEARQSRRRDTGEAVVLVVEADVADTAAAVAPPVRPVPAWNDPAAAERWAAQPGYNDPAHRERQLLARLQGADVGGEATAARMAVAVAQPEPVTAAVARGATTKAPAKAARKMVSKGAEPEHSR